MTTRLPFLLALLAVLAGLASAPPPVRGQMVVEDLERDLESEMRSSMDEAMARFRSVDQPESIPLLSRVIDELAGDAVATAEDPALLEILARALALRSEALFNLGDGPAASRDLATLLTIDPGFRLDEERVSPKLVSTLEDLRASSVGRLILRVGPADSRVLVDGVEIESGRTEVPLLAGERLVRVERPGFLPLEERITVGASADEVLKADLERVAPTLSLSVRPAGATVRVDGAPAGDGAGSANGERLVAVELGAHRVTVSAPGHRPRTLALRLDRLADYRLPAIVLEPARGRIVVADIPEGSSLTLDGQRVAHGDGADAVLTLAPGSYRLEVRAGARGAWSRLVPLADRQEVGLLVRLRPSLVFLGFGGEDRVAGIELAGQIAQNLGSSERWFFSSAADDDGQPEPALGLETIDWAHLGDEPWRVAALPPPGDGWTALQARLDSEVGGSAYLLVTVRGAPYADVADLWLWSAGPGPARPWHRRFAIDSRTGKAPWLRELERPIVFSTPWTGVDLVEIPGKDGLRVVAVAAEGPGARAGLAPGDRIAAVGDLPATLESFRSLVAEGAGELTLDTHRGPVRTPRTLLPVPVPTLVPADGGGPPDPALWAVLACPDTPEVTTASPWLTELLRALVLLRADRPDAAADRLGTLEPPSGPGLGRGTVDLWRGIALLRTGRGGVEAARALESAAASASRLSGVDGAPAVAPLARAWSRP